MNGFGSNTIDIDQLVQKVMSDLGMKDGGGEPSAVPEPVSQPAKKDLKRESASDQDLTLLRLSSRVITLEQIRQGKAGKGKIKQIAVPANAVLTPSVRDEIKKQGWNLVFDSAAVSSQRRVNPSSSNESSLFTVSASNLGQASISQSSFVKGAGGYFQTLNRESVPAVSPLGKLVLAFHALPQETVPSSYTDFLRKSVSVDVFQSKCIMAVADHLADVLVSPENKSVLITKFGAVASAVCNRHTSLRAIIGTDPTQMEKDALSLGANLLIIDPGSGFFRVRQMINRFAALGAVVCPSIIRKGLEG